MPKLRIGSTELWLVLVIAVMIIGLGLLTDTFLTLPNLFDLLNTSAVNIIFGVGLLVVLIAGGIDISFTVAASVVQYLTATTVAALGGGDWALGFAPWLWPVRRCAGLFQRRAELPIPHCVDRGDDRDLQSVFRRPDVLVGRRLSL